MRWGRKWERARGKGKAAREEGVGLIVEQRRNKGKAESSGVVYTSVVLWESRVLR